MNAKLLLPALVACGLLAAQTPPKDGSHAAPAPRVKHPENPSMLRLPFKGDDEVAIFLNDFSSKNPKPQRVQIRMWLSIGHSKALTDGKHVEKTTTNFWVSPIVTIPPGQTLDFTKKKTAERRSAVHKGGDLNEQLKALADHLKQISAEHPEIKNAPHPEFKIRLDRVDEKGKAVASSYLFTSLDFGPDAFGPKGFIKNQIHMKVDDVDAHFEAAVVRKQK